MSEVKLGIDNIGIDELAIHKSIRSYLLLADLINHPLILYRPLIGIPLPLPIPLTALCAAPGGKPLCGACGCWLS